VAPGGVRVDLCAWRGNSAGLGFRALEGAVLAVGFPLRIGGGGGAWSEWLRVNSATVRVLEEQAFCALGWVIRRQEVRFRRDCALDAVVLLEFGEIPGGVSILLVRAGKVRLWLGEAPSAA
jgi:hypothetical protein